MANIAYIDHSYHRVTRSTFFLIQALREHGHQVTLFWDDGWQGGKAIEWREVRAYDVVIMFQSFCKPSTKRFCDAHPNVIYIPMLDQFGLWQGPNNLSAFWEPFQGSKVLNFSNVLHSMTLGFGIASHYVRYYQPPGNFQLPPKEGLHGFFWVRREKELPWQTIHRLIGKTRFDSFHVHLAVDPGTPPAELPSSDDLARHNITTSVWFENKSDLDKCIERANVYFAPRLEEGIGQSFLEGMVRGQCVIAPNYGTMNEYIIHGVNGLLYDPQNPAPLDFSDVVELGRQARKGASLGYAQWRRMEEALLDFILAPSEIFYRNKIMKTPPSKRVSRLRYFIRRAKALKHRSKSRF